MVSRLLGIRLPEEIMERFENIANQKNESSNQLGKKAIMEWMEILFSSRIFNMIIFPRDILLKTLNFLNDEQRNTISNEIASNINEYIQFLFKSRKPFQPDSELYHHVLTKFLGPTGLMWYNHIEIQFPKNKNELGEFHASHTSGKNWSKITLIVLQKILQEQFHISIDQKTIFTGNSSVTFSFSFKI